MAMLGWLTKVYSTLFKIIYHITDSFTVMLSHDFLHCKMDKSSNILRKMVVMLFLQLALIVCSFGHIGPHDISTTRCSDWSPTSADSTKTLPTLGTQYTAHIEANIVQKNQTIDVEEYYDYDKKVGIIVITKEGKRTIRIIDFNTKEMHEIADDLTCSVRNLSLVTKNPFNFALGYGSADKMSSINAIFLLGQKHSTTYMGMNYARGRLVEHWQSCMKVVNNDTVFTIDYYFSAEGYSTANHQERIPVRITINGTISGATKHTFYHSYEFVFYEKGPPKDPWQGNTVPPGVFCTSAAGPGPQKKMPPISGDATMEVETIRLYRNGSLSRTSHRMYFDFDWKVVRTDRPYPADKGVRAKFGKYPIQKTDDFKNGLTYIVNGIEKNCTVMPIPDTDDNAVFRTPGAKAIFVRMKTLSEFFGLNKTFIYQGKRNIRKIPVEMWGYQNATSKEVTEVYFYQKFAPPSGGSQPAHSGSQPGQGSSKYGSDNFELVGIYNDRSQTGQDEVQLYNYVSSYSEGHPDIGIFDVGICYDGIAHRDLKFEVTGSQKSDVVHKRREFYTAIADKILGITGLPYTRLSRLMTEELTDTRIHITFTIFDTHRAQVEGIPSVSLDQAYNKLTDAFKNDMTFTVTSPIDTPKTYKLVSSTFGASSKAVSEQETSTSYRPGDMAGLGIAMFAIGAIIGLVIAYFIHKRTSNPGFAYEVDKS